MPPRQEEELDPVSLHNFGLMNMEAEPNQGFKKLNFLVQNPPFPVETFSNLLVNTFMTTNECQLISVP